MCRPGCSTRRTGGTSSRSGSFRNGSTACWPATPRRARGWCGRRAASQYQAFKEAPYKDEFDEWLARIVCYAFSLPPTAFTRQVNRATAETAQEAALAEGLAPLMGWVKRLVDHVIQDRMGQPDLEFAWVDLRPADPAEQAKMLDTYVRNGVYTVNEARDLLGLDPVPGGDRPMVYGTQGAVPLGTSGPVVNKAHRSLRDPASKRLFSDMSLASSAS